MNKIFTAKTIILLLWIVPSIISIEKYLEIFVVCDYSCSEKLKGEKKDPEKFVTDLILGADKRLSRIDVRVFLTGIDIWREKNLVQANNNFNAYLRNFSPYRVKQIEDRGIWSDITVLITSLPTSNVNGLFPIGGACSLFQGAGVVIFQSSTDVAIHFLTHELGHAIGMNHDVSGCCKYGESRCLMNPTINAFNRDTGYISSCSLKDYRNFLKSQGSQCLNNKPTRAYKAHSFSNQCGNGIINEDEECDCGGALDNGCRNCCKEDCKLKDGALCGQGECCNVKLCKFHDAGKLCRYNKDNDCDVKETCTGTNSDCPEDLRKDNLTKCVDSDGNEASCIKGHCLTLTNQCKLVWNSDYRKADNYCYEVAIRYFDRYAHCGIVKDANGKASYVKCSNSKKNNFNCGLLQCVKDNLTNANEWVLDRDSTQSASKNPIMPALGKQDLACLKTTYGDWIIQENGQNVDVMVADGSPCGESGVCLERNCIDQKTFKNYLENSTTETNKRIGFCGDGIVDEKEECDCGIYQACDCCNSRTCKLLKGSCPNRDDCQYCNGFDSKCIKKETFQSCDNDFGKCINGVCKSLRKNCQERFEELAVPDLNSTELNMQGLGLYNQGGYILLAYFLLQRVEVYGRHYQIFQSLLTDISTPCQKNGRQGICKHIKILDRKRMFCLKDDLRSLITCGCKEPMVFRHAAKEWPLTGRVLENLDKLTSKQQKIHVGKKSWLYNKDAKFETERNYISVSLSDYKKWLLSDKETLKGINRNDTWTYLSYVHIGEMLDEKSDKRLFEDGIKWSDMGFNDLNGIDSTFWLGSQFCYTPLHSDSYGCNLVAQLEGSKTWILFPPTEEKAIYPTRIPYEESSDVEAYKVELKEGDILYVPPVWWHFVYNENSRISASINTWIPIKTDDFSRIEEAIVKYIIMKNLGNGNFLSHSHEWLNPNENAYTVSDCLLLINQSLNASNKCLGVKRQKLDYIDDNDLDTILNDTQAFVDYTENTDRKHCSHEIKVDELFNCQLLEKIKTRDLARNFEKTEYPEENERNVEFKQRQEIYEHIRTITYPSSIKYMAKKLVDIYRSKLKD
ncbi:DgyrCDS3886 [Dimorphilus gyrociliatus]|uniref:DgyrCDS3886 n=1 Tax=Dimorphilus gyrociliatus TaxID=2664684 RepID=A0A7I8VGM3_9ANNE|nr:DgyrCDS3886 [Dimorphilus gyrociliatus]